MRVWRKQAAGNSRRQAWCRNVPSGALTSGHGFSEVFGSEEIDHVDSQLEEHRVSRLNGENPLPFQHVMHMWLGDSREVGELSLSELPAANSFAHECDKATL